jgi:membrane fusion protein (multidrug efflux system)
VAKAVQRLAELDLEYTEIKASVAGRIGESDIFVGGLATKNSPKPLTLLSPLDPVQVKVRIGEREYLNYAQRARTDGNQKGSRVSDLQLLLADGSVYPQAGQLRSVDRAVDPQTGTLGVTLDFPNPEAILLPGTSIRVRVRTSEKGNVLLVPQRAIIELQGIRSVYVADNEDKVVSRTVTATDRVGSLWIIEKGLEAGERVIVEGIQKVQPGAKVQVKVEPEPKLEQTAESLQTNPKPN